MSAIIQSNKDFEVFFRENFPSVYAFMKRYTGDDELAADLAQETFIRVYERRDEIVSVDYGKLFYTRLHVICIGIIVSINGRKKIILHSWMRMTWMIMIFCRRLPDRKPCGFYILLLTGCHHRLVR